MTVGDAQHDSGQVRGVTVGSTWRDSGDVPSRESPLRPYYRRGLSNFNTCSSSAMASVISAAIGAGGAPPGDPMPVR